VRPLLVGLTGGLAAGKSRVAELLQESGLAVWDADRLIADLYRAGEPGAAAVAELFGDSLLDDGGAVSHSRLADLVFRDPAARRRLERAIHPLVRERFRALAEAADADAAVLEGTLLVEAGFAADFDLLVSVESDAGLRRQRAIERGLSPEDADRRLAAQGGGEARRRAAGWLIDNRGDLTDLRRHVARLVAEIRTRAAERRHPLAPTPH